MAEPDRRPARGRLPQRRRHRAAAVRAVAPHGSHAVTDRCSPASKPGGELLRQRCATIGIEPEVFPLRGTLAQAEHRVSGRAHGDAHPRGTTSASSTRTTSTPTSSASPPRRSRACARSPRAAICAHWLGGRSESAAPRLPLADAVVANAAAVAEQTERDLGVDAGQDARGAQRHRRRALQSAGVPDARAARCRRATSACPRVCMVGSMHLPDKGTPICSRRRRIFKARGVRAQYLLVSDGGLRAELEAQARALGLGDDVVFLGRRDDVPSVLVRCDVVAHPVVVRRLPQRGARGDVRRAPRRRHARRRHPRGHARRRARPARRRRSVRPSSPRRSRSSSPTRSPATSWACAAASHVEARVLARQDVRDRQALYDAARRAQRATMSAGRRPDMTLSRGG